MRGASSAFPVGILTMTSGDLCVVFIFFNQWIRIRTKHLLIVVVFVLLSILLFLFLWSPPILLFLFLWSSTALFVVSVVVVYVVVFEGCHSSLVTLFNSPSNSSSIVITLAIACSSFSLPSPSSFCLSFPIIVFTSERENFRSPL